MPEELSAPFAKLKNMNKAMLQEIGGYYEEFEDLKYIKEFMHVLMFETSC